MAEWEEVRRLAADFQRIQAASTVHRLSERNCIELVNKLLSMGLVEVLYTLDGKEYVTPHHLEREIRDELTVHRGIMGTGVERNFVRAALGYRGHCDVN